MEQNVAKRLTDAVRAFNVQADRARRKGLPFVVEARASGKSGSGGVFHLHVLRSMPVAVGLLPEARDDQCAAEIALLSAAEEVNRLADEAWRQNIGIDLRVVGRQRGAEPAGRTRAAGITVTPRCAGRSTWRGTATGDWGRCGRSGDEVNVLDPAVRQAGDDAPISA